MLFGGDANESEDLASMTFEEIKRIREACLSHAEELQAAAKQVVEGSPHVGYHLAALALEEIGKGQILLIEVTPGHPEEAARSFEKMREDHVKKLFWALWGPTFTREHVSPEQIRDLQGLANTIHEKRLAGLYVDWRAGDLMIPKKAVSPERARNLIGLVAACLGLERAGELKEPSTEERELAAWFVKASRHDEHAQLVFGRKSIEKLNELGDAQAWIAWLKQEFEESARMSRELLERELARTEPGAAERFEPKWLIRFRLFTPSHSVRQGILARFNAVSQHLKFHGAKPNELIVDYVLPKGLHVGWLWEAGLSSAEHVLLALNVGSFGFFWWQPSRYTATYFERIEDLEAKNEVRVERVPKLKVNWGRNVLDDGALNRMLLALSCIPLPNGQRAEEDPYRHYLDGLAFLGKTDIHLQLEGNAFESFFKAFKMATKLYGDWDGASDFRVSASAVIDRMAADAQSWREFVEIGMVMTTDGDPPRAIDLGNAASMKVWCDFYLFKIFQRLAAERRERSRELEETDDTGDRAKS